MGLSLFIFMSGYLSYYNNHSINSLQNVFDFYKKAFENLSPLLGYRAYLFVLVFFVFAPRFNSSFVFPNSENVFGFYNVFVHVLGYRNPCLLRLMLVPYVNTIFYRFNCYFLCHLSVNPYVLKNYKKYIALLSISDSFLISKTFRIIDYRFFHVFLIFVFGILTCKESQFGKAVKKPVIKTLSRVLLAILPVIFVLTIIMGLRESLFLDPRVSVTIDTGSAIIGSS